MTKWILPTLATLSAITVGILLIGCFIRLGTDLYVSSHLGGMMIGAQIDGGRCRVDRWISRMPTASYEFNIDFDRPKIRLADAKRMLWEFDARQFPVGPNGEQMTFVEFPIWVALIPCLIAPFIWLRSRRRKIKRGFSVINVSLK